MKFPSCNFCDRPAVWKRPWDHDHLCRYHFNTAFEKKVQKTINKYKLFERDDIIAVGLSGGKDSVVLLETMAKLQKKHPSKVVAISIDEGIANYREDGLKFAKMTAEQNGVEHHVFSFEEMFDYGLDDAMKVLQPKGKGACSYCGPFRRKALNLAARAVGATKLATGHNADDEAQTLLMNVLRGDILKTLRGNPTPTFKNPAFVNRVKPFRRTSEMEIVLYAQFNHLPYQEMSCPYAVDAYRGDVRDILTQLKEEDPGVIFSIIKSSDDLHHLGSFVPKEVEHDGNKSIYECKICGEPSNQIYCQTCSIQLSIKNLSEKI